MNSINKTFRCFQKESNGVFWLGANIMPSSSINLNENKYVVISQLKEQLFKDAKKEELVIPLPPSPPSPPSPPPPIVIKRKKQKMNSVTFEEPNECKIYVPSLPPPPIVIKRKKQRMDVSNDKTLSVPESHAFCSVPVIIRRKKPVTTPASLFSPPPPSVPVIIRRKKTANSMIEVPPSPPVIIRRKKTINKSMTIEQTSNGDKEGEKIKRMLEKKGYSVIEQSIETKYTFVCVKK
jgi:hypothetical protein